MNAANDNTHYQHYHPTLCGRRVLVVEDEPLIAMLLEEQLLEAGAEVVGPANSVGDALRLIEQTAFNGGLSAGVLDVNLGGALVAPGADRLAALGVPFVFAAGYGAECDKGLHTAAPVLAKPFVPHLLVVAIEGLTAASG